MIPRSVLPLYLSSELNKMTTVANQAPRKQGRKDPQQQAQPQLQLQPGLPTVQPPRQRQRRKQGKKSAKDAIVIPPRQVEVDFNSSPKKSAQQQRQMSTNNSNSHRNQKQTPALPNGSKPVFNTNATPKLVQVAAEALLATPSSASSSQGTHSLPLTQYAGSSFQNEPKAVTLPKPSFLRRK